MKKVCETCYFGKDYCCRKGKTMVECLFPLTQGSHPFDTNRNSTCGNWITEKQYKAKKNENKC